jgi:hypothetical protein
VGDITWKNKYLVINSEGQRTCGRSRHRWKENIEPYGELLGHCVDFSISGACEWLVVSQE